VAVIGKDWPDDCEFALARAVVTGVNRWLCFGVCAMQSTVWFSAAVVMVAAAGGLSGARELPNSRSRGPLCAMQSTVWFSSAVVGAAEIWGLIGKRALPSFRSRGPVAGPLVAQTAWRVMLLVLIARLGVADPLLDGKLGVPEPLAGMLVVTEPMDGMLVVTEPDACSVVTALSCTEACFGVAETDSCAEGAATMDCTIQSAVKLSSAVVASAETGGLIGTPTLPNSRSRGPVTGKLAAHNAWRLRLLV